MAIGTAPATSGVSSPQASDGWIASVGKVVGSGLTDLFKTGTDAAKSYLADQWGLDKTGNGIDQRIFSNQQFQTAQQPQVTNTGLLTGDTTLSVPPNSILIIAVIGAVILFALKR